MNFMTPVGDGLQPLPIFSDESDSLINFSNSSCVSNSNVPSAGGEGCMLPIVPEGAHFGDSLQCATINSCGSGEGFVKIDVITDFAVDEKLDIVFVTELKTTLARANEKSVRHKGFFSWWGARNTQQSFNDGVVLLVCDEWAKYVQGVDYWGGCLHG